MTASALNIASVVPNAAAGVGQAVSAVAAGKGGLAGFEALLGALFPQAGAMPAAATTATTVPAADAQPASLAVPALLAAVVDGEEAPSDAATPDTAATEAATTEATPDAAAAAAALAAAAVTPQPTAAAPAPQPTQAAEPATDAPAPNAWGRDKAKGAPAQPAILHANPKAGLEAKAPDAEAAAAAAVEGEVPQDAETTPAPVAAPSERAASAAAQHAAARAPQAAPPPAAVAAATPQVAIEAPVDVAAAPAATPASEPAPTQAAPPVASVATTAPPVQSQALAAAQPAPKAEAPQPNARPARAERGKAAAEPARDAEPAMIATADRPDTAKPTAKSGSAATEAPASEVAEARREVEAEAPDGTPQVDARPATASAAPAAHATHAVRGSPETVAHLAAQIVKKLDGQSTRFDVELNPHGLGKVDVRVEIGANGQVSAAMLFDNPQSAQELKSRAAELQRALEQAGFDLSGGLSFDVAGDQGRQGQAWQDQGDNRGGAHRGQAFRAALENAGEADVAAQGALRLRRGVNAGLDVRI